MHVAEAQWLLDTFLQLLADRGRSEAVYNCFGRLYQPIDSLQDFRLTQTWTKSLVPSSQRFKFTVNSSKQLCIPNQPST